MILETTKNPFKHHRYLNWDCRIQHSKY